MWAKISSIYKMDGFKTILAVVGGNFAVFYNMHMKAKVSLSIYVYHQESVHCQVNLFLAAF